jgi:hypothetical protein
LVGHLVGDLGVDELGQRRQVTGRPVGEPAADHHRLQIHVQPRGDHGFVAAGNHHQFIDELVVGTPPAAHLPTQCAFLGFGHRLNDQDLEVELIRLGGRLLFEQARVGRVHVVVVKAGVLNVSSAVGICRQRPVDAGHHLRELVVAARGEQTLNPGELRRARIRPIRLERSQLCQQIAADCDVLLLELPGTRRPGQALSGLLQPAPGVSAQLPDAVVCTRIVCHLRPLRRILTIRRPGRNRVKSGRANQFLRRSADERTPATCEYAFVTVRCCSP